MKNNKLKAILKNNKSIIIVTFVLVSIFLILTIFNNINNIKNINTTTNNDVAYVYVDNEQIAQYDLTKDAIYELDNLDYHLQIEVKDKKIRVSKSDCPNHICEKQGFIASNSQIITCLPNRLYIKIGNI